MYAKVLSVNLVESRYRRAAVQVERRRSMSDRFSAESAIRRSLDVGLGDYRLGLRIDLAGRSARSARRSRRRALPAAGEPGRVDRALARGLAVPAASSARAREALQRYLGG